MKRKLGWISLIAASSVVAAPVRASDLVVAVDPEQLSEAKAPPPRKPRKDVAFAASLYALTATAFDGGDAVEMAFMFRPALELYVSIGLGNVSLVLGGTTLALEVYAYDERTSLNYPALLTAGIHHDRWLLEAAGGVSLASEDSAGRFHTERDEEPLPSPRGELRAGARFSELFELRGVIGVERRIDGTDDGVTRYFAGVCAGIGGE